MKLVVPLQIYNEASTKKKTEWIIVFIIECEVV